MARKLSKQSSLPTPTTPGGTGGTGTTPPSPLLTDTLPLPRAIIFDLDYTLWPFWVDTHVNPPLRASSTHTTCTDKTGESFSFYREIPHILPSLLASHIKLGVASRTCAPELGREMLKLLHVPDGTTGTRKAIDVFEAGLEIYPSSKIRHFEALHKRTGIPYSEMLFFDDESRNRDTESLGVTMWLVRNGVTWVEIENGIREWRRRRGVA